MAARSTGRVTPKGGPAPNGHRPATFDHLKAKAPLERTVSVVLSDEAVRAWEVASSAYEGARLAGRVTPELEAGRVTPELEAARDEARAAVEAATVTLRFRSIGRRRYDSLVEDHPVSDEGRQRAQDQGAPAPPYDVETFAPALIAASCVDPVLTVEQVGEIWDEWNTAELMELWAAALEVCTQRRVVDLGKAGYG